MTLLDERSSGKVCVSYQKQTVVDAIDEIMATAQRIPNLDITRVCYSWYNESIRCNLPGWILAYMYMYASIDALFMHMFSILRIN